MKSLLMQITVVYHRLINLLANWDSVGYSRMLAYYIYIKLAQLLRSIFAYLFLDSIILYKEVIVFY